MARPEARPGPRYAQVYLAPNLWEDADRISAEEYTGLELTFTPEELDEVLESMKPDSAPGPDGLPVLFFKKFWNILKGPILQILNDFALGRVDIARLNFGIISLIPKVKGVDCIKKFRPIVLINVIFKFVAKAYAIRLAPIANRTIDRSQTAFIKGRSLHEGVLALHEISHELRTKNLQGLLLKLDFEKANDRVSVIVVNRQMLWDDLSWGRMGARGFGGGFLIRLDELLDAFLKNLA